MQWVAAIVRRQWADKIALSGENETISHVSEGASGLVRVASFGTPLAQARFSSATEPRP